MGLKGQIILNFFESVGIRNDASSTVRSSLILLLLLCIFCAWFSVYCAILSVASSFAIISLLEEISAPEALL